jgi:hypothetical protein
MGLDTYPILGDGFRCLTSNIRFTCKSARKLFLLCLISSQRVNPKRFIAAENDIRARVAKTHFSAIAY